MATKEGNFYKFNPRYKANKERPILKKLIKNYPNYINLKKKSNSFDIFNSNLKKKISQKYKKKKKNKPIMFYAFRFLSDKIFSEKIFKS